MATPLPPSLKPLPRLVDWLDSLSPDERNGLAARYSRATAEGGATMRKPDGRVVPIPPLLTPEVLDEHRVAQMEDGAHSLMVALARLTGWLMSPRGDALRPRMFAAFGPFETEALATWREAERLVTARVDYLVGDDGAEWALEVNSTIPAMQGYSDIVASAFLHEAGRMLGHAPRACDLLSDANGRNGDQLLASLLAHHALLGGEGEPRIAIVAREGDSQLGELEYLAARWSLLGCASRIFTPAQLRRDGARLVAPDFIPDVIYRHVFARRLDPASDFARACLEPRTFRILNPISSHLEVKGMLGLLSAAAAQSNDEFAAEVGLSSEERGAIARSVPWTRLLMPGETMGYAGETIPDLVSAVANEPEYFVLKRGWDYGGKSVFLGVDHDEDAQARAAASLGRSGSMRWRELVAAAAADTRDMWVVQRLVHGARRRHLVAADGVATWKELYVDLSVFTNLGVDVRPKGGVSRAAPRRIVNLQGGGGLAPLIRADVLGRLLGKH